MLKKIDVKSWLLIFIGAITWSLTMVKSGITYSYGMGFWGANGHDGVWHIALIESLAKGSWDIPIFAGTKLQNYHIGFDLFVAMLHKLTFISVSTLYFQILPPLFALLIGIFGYLFVYEWKKSRSQAFWATFFIYFAGSWGWLVNLLRGQEIGGESMFWSQQSISTLINPPFAMSLLFIFLGLWLLIKEEKTRNRKQLFLLSILFGLLIEVKVYAGILVLGALFVAGIWQFIKERQLNYLKLFIGSLIISILVFLPLFNPNVQTLVFQPFWFLDTMMAVSDRFYWPRFAEALGNYRLANNYLKLTLAYGVAFLIFWYGNLGTRGLKEFTVWKWIKKFPNISPIEVLIATIIIAGLVFPMLFVQVGTPWNTIQFLYYSLMFSGILAGISFGEWVGNVSRSKYLVASVILILFTVPTTVSTLRQYLPSRPPAKLSNDELQALQFLEQQPDGIVLTYPYDSFKAKEAENNPPRPLYLYESTAYVSAFSQKQTFLEDQVNLNITGYNWQSRRMEVDAFYQSVDSEFVYNFLRSHNIKYIYWLKGQRATEGESQLGITKIFENGEVDIYRVI